MPSVRVEARGTSGGRGMTIWIDAQLSPRIAKWIVDRFAIEAVPVREVGLRDAGDTTSSARRVKLMWSC